MFCPLCGEYAGRCDETCGYVSQGDYPGTAPGARLVAHDAGDDNGFLYVGGDYKTTLIEAAYLTGARTFSQSWGVSSPGNLYDSSVRAFDEFTYEADDVLFVFGTLLEHSIDITQL